MEMTSGQRLELAFSHKEPDRVPYVFPAAMHPAKYMGLSIKEYFSNPEYVVKGQLELRKRFGNDILCCYPFAALEMAAWGGEVIYFDDGPPNAGAPVIKRSEDILSLEPPEVVGNRALEPVLEAISGLRRAVGEEIPIAGAIVSPFSLPIMQMGFESYINLIYERPELVERLMRINVEYCASWAEAQLKAGAGSIMSYDPALSTTIMSRDIVRQYGLPADRELIARINGGVLIHLASGRSLDLVDEMVEICSVGISAGAEEDLGELKGACRGRLTVIGNLNAMEMRRWTPEQAEAEVKKAIAQGAGGGGFVLSDFHGEIPFLVDDEILSAAAEAVRRWGRYPLDWTALDEQ